MTNEEVLARESIRKTLTNYTMAGDRLKEKEFVAVFTDDAILETDGVPQQDTFRHEGRAAIEAWMRRWRQSAGSTQETVHQATFVRHHLSTCQIEFADSVTARVRTYWTAYTDIGPDHCGYYVDTLRKVDEQWLIAHRKIRMDWRSANSLMFTAISMTTRS